MRLSRVAAIAVTGALALGPAGAHANEWSGLLALRYERAELDRPDTARAIEPRLDFDARLDASGAVLAPGTIDWIAAVAYRRLQATRFDVDTTDDILTFRARVGLLERPASPFTLSAEASRSRDDFASSGGAAAPVAGDRVTETYGAVATLAPAGLPLLQIGGSAFDSEDHRRGLPDASRRSRTLTGSSKHTVEGWSYRLDYRGSWNEGTYPADNYDDQSVRFDGRAPLAPQAEAFASQAYYLRTPTLAAVTNPRYEDNRWTGGARWSSDASMQSALYTYSHSVAESAGAQDRERLSHQAAYTHQRTLTPRWDVTGTLDANYGQDRLGLDERRRAGQSLGGILRWRDLRMLELRGGPTVGLVEELDGDVEPGWGLTAEAVVQIGRGPARGQLSYAGGYADRLRGLDGWSLHQAVTGTVEGDLGAGMQVRAQLRANARRIESDLFGSAAGRTLVLDAGWRYRRYEARLLAGLDQGANAAAGDSVHGDGLLLAPYSASTHHATLSAYAPVWGRLALVGSFRYSRSKAPDRPNTLEMGASLTAEYAVGALTLSLEDRYTASGVDSLDLSENVLIFQLARTFGSRF